MQSNPIIEKQEKLEAEQRARERFRYPYRVVCVYLDTYNSDFPIIHEVRDHCNQNSMIFTARAFDSDRYTEDEYVKRLPAFHVYYNGGIYETLYFDIDPVHKLKLIIWAYEDELLAKEKARIRRQERWEAFKSMFSFKKKTVLDLDMSLRHTS